jgi:hypothetical protein
MFNFGDDRPDAERADSSATVLRVRLTPDLAAKFGFQEAYLFVLGQQGPLLSCAFSDDHFQPMTRTVNGQEFSKVVLIPQQVESYVVQDAEMVLNPGARTAAERHQLNLVDRLDGLWQRKQKGWQQ